MPRKSTKASRQASGHRKATVRPRRNPAQGSAAASQAVGARQTAPSLAAAPPAAATATQARPVRRPAPSTGGALSPEQVRNEGRYIRRDLVKMLLTTLVVLAFMVAANLIINS